VYEEEPTDRGGGPRRKISGANLLKQNSVLEDGKAMSESELMIFCFAQLFAIVLAFS
jgi:hypothetical protein